SGPDRPDLQGAARLLLHEFHPPDVRAAERVARRIRRRIEKLDGAVSRRGAVRVRARRDGEQQERGEGAHHSSASPFRNVFTLPTMASWSQFLASTMSASSARTGTPAASSAALVIFVPDWDKRLS